MKISEAIFSGSSIRVAGKPSEKLPEFAFIGRSNVGTSSLINALCNNRKLAMTSATPGKTKLVNHFRINGEWYLVDLPGYGYAKMPVKEKEKLQEVIKDYLNNSEELVILFVLVDARHDPQKVDLDFMNELVDIYEETGDDVKAKKYRDKITLIQHNIELDEEEKAEETAKDGLQ